MIYKTGNMVVTLPSENDWDVPSPLERNPENCNEQNTLWL
jgi:hypothetical protein